MTYLSKLVTQLEESQTIAMAQKSRLLKSQGHDVISLSLGEPDFPTPKHICEAATQAMADGYTHYTPVAGFPELRQAIADKLKRDNNVDFSAKQIVVSTGAKHSIINVLLSILDRGDEVIIPTPFWVSYKSMVELSKGTPVTIKASVAEDFKITPEQLRSALNEKTKAFLFSSPCNPSGSVYTQEELKGLAEVLKEFPKVLVISDEIYELINFEGAHQSISQFEWIKDRIVIINGMSKGYAMTGWRIGYMAGPIEVSQACEKLQGQFTSGTNSIAQRAAIAALNGDHAPSYAMRDAFKERRELVFKALDEMEGVIPNYPKGAFYVFPDISSYFGKSSNGRVINNSQDLSMYLLEDHLVAVVAGSAFGNDENIRVSFATSKDKLIEAMRRIKAGLAALS